MKSMILGLFIVAAACSNNNSSASLEVGDAPAYEEIVVPATIQPRQESINSEQITQKLIKTGTLNFQSENIEEDYQKIRKLIPLFNAYVENVTQSKTDYRISYKMKVRVPSDNYDSLFQRCVAIAVKLDNKSSQIMDVTDRYYDLATRIKNKKALESRYRQLLTQATEIKDILEIEHKLTNVRTEIEQLEGQFNYLKKQIQFSEINLSFYEELPYVYEAYKRKGFGNRIASAFSSGWNGFLSAIVGITTLWPFLIVLFLSLFIFRKYKMKKRTK